MSKVYALEICNEWPIIPVVFFIQKETQHDLLTWNLLDYQAKMWTFAGLLGLPWDTIGQCNQVFDGLKR